MIFAVNLCVDDLATLEAMTAKPFDQLMLNPDIIMKMKKSGLRLPTPIQSAALPLVLEGRGMFLPPNVSIYKLSFLQIC